MKKSNAWLIALPLLLCACDGGAASSGSSSTSTESSVSLTEEEKTKPESSDLVYTDYAQTDDPNEELWYRNDLEDKELPDPFVFADDDGKFYLFGTVDRTGAKCFDCYETTDFVHFTPHLNVYTPSSSTWVKSSLFAPEVYKFGDTYYLYYSANDENGNHYLNVATSSSITGPYTDYVGKDADGNDVDFQANPFLKDSNNSLGIELGVLDQTLLVDGDDIYLYYSIYDDQITKMQYIVGMKMKDPVTPDWTTYTKLLSPAVASPDMPRDTVAYKFPWERYTSNLDVAEGPCVVKSPVNGKYYLTYSVNHYDNFYYTVCYAVSDSPLGTYEKPYAEGDNWSNILFGYGGGTPGTTVYNQWKGFMVGTGHHSIFKAGDQYMIVYHAWSNRGTDTFSGRRVAFDHFYWDDETGEPYVHGPSYSVEPLPEYVTGLTNIALNAEIAAENVENPERLIDNHIVEHYNLSWESENAEATLGEGMSYIRLKFDRKYKIRGISIYNSAFYNKYVPEIDYINFGNGNAILNGVFPSRYVNDETEFVFPCSAFTYDFDEIETDTIIIGISSEKVSALNEIAVFGY